MKTAKEWYETLEAGDIWNDLSEPRRADEEHYITGIREEAAQACVDAYCAADLSLTRVEVGQLILAAARQPDPRREALGRKLYETLNIGGTPWEDHAESMHERYREAAAAVREES